MEINLLGAFYAQDFGTGNLELLSRFFEKYPAYADRVFLSVKGANTPNSLNFDGSPENLKRSVEECTTALRGKKKIDLFECARIPPNNTLENVLDVLKGFVNEGYFDYIGMSECSAETLKKAAAVSALFQRLTHLFIAVYPR
jgi:pyridoxine 4-dehydrogenase